MPNKPPIRHAKSAFYLSLAFSVMCCAGGSGNGSDGEGAIESAPPSAPAEAPKAPAALAHFGTTFEPWFGDFPEMVERKLLRAVVPYSRTHYFLDGAEAKGISHDAIRELSTSLNKVYGSRSHEIAVAMLPVARDQIVPMLVAGHADFAVANLTITPERSELVDFTVPSISNVREIVVTGPDSPEIHELADLSGQEVWVRASSSYYSSLLALNAELTEGGKEPVVIRTAQEYFESEDLLEMVNGGLIPITIIDEHIGNFWSQIFDDVTFHNDLAISEGNEIAVMLRKETPELRKVLDEFVSKNKKGSLLGNILFKRYLKDTHYVRNSLDAEELARFRNMVDIFRTYANDYAFDWLLIAAQGYQESRLDQNLVSPVGAIGVMQVMPATATSQEVGIPDIRKLEPNIHAGVKYLRHITDHYFGDPEIDEFNRTLFGFAAYNAGPTRISRLRKTARERGLDANVWFRNVELVVAEKVGREPIRYVANIVKYHAAYKLVQENFERSGRPSRLD